ncbi:recombinase family protein [Clostridium algidicarnis]|uniref:recombinase family protein n=1 Tax=Clostridium algidicarnis TaxID=37659 RepID=UPI001C0CE18B|nr:recombinase family protein [Clostridium algidicarnis]MBU3195700.1 recombinase family protein [Clostridium algidicarnis]
MKGVCIYLRKSRADEELEKSLGEGETLSKHRKALLKFAKDKKINIVEIKEEIVSGESLFFRPKMLELLKEVEDKKYSGVLVMDMQRLGRGDMQDQGLILKTFKDSHTLIVTPQKTYDLHNDFDEEYSEFEAFMSRKELKMINRRMQGGRVRSIEEGNYISPTPPYGYDIHFINKNRTLKVNKDESEIVKLILNMYLEGNGAGIIANHLNSLGCKTKFGNSFSSSSVLFILKNPVYIGKVTWKKKEIKKSKDIDKLTDTRTRDIDEWIIADGKHEAIIKEDIFNKATEILKGRYHVPYKLTNGMANPLAGIVICSVCGNKMVLRKSRGVDRILCNKSCGNKSVRYDYLENAMLTALDDYLKEYKINIKNNKPNNNVKAYEVQLEVNRNELENLNNQKLKLFDLLERGIYDDDTFLERTKNLDDRIKSIKDNVNKLVSAVEKDSKTATKKDIIKFENTIQAYKVATNIQLKNTLIKNILHKVEFKKEKHQRDNNFTIEIYPRV